MLPSEIVKKVKGIEIKTRKLVEELFGGEYHSAFKGQGMEFDEVREYQPGDDVRNIDWNVTARMGAPFIKKFAEERELTLLLVADASASGIFGTKVSFKRDSATEACALLAFSAIKNNDRVGLLYFTDKVELFVPPRKGKSHVLRLIRELLAFEPQGKGTDIGGALEYATRVLTRKSLVFLVSDFLDNSFERPLSVAAKKHDLTALQIVDPMEENLPSAGLIRMRDIESDKSILIDSSSQEIRDFWAERFKKRQNKLKKIMGRTGTDHILLKTDQAIDKPLRDFFAARGQRRKKGHRI